MNPRSRAWTAAILGVACLWSIHLLRGFLELAPAVPGRFGACIRVTCAVLIGATMLLLFAILFVRDRLTVRHWELMAAALFAIAVVIPAVGKTTGRLILGPQAMILDAILQVEVASGMLAQGKNPYAENFFGTDLERWNRGMDRTPMHHLVYPPLPIVVTLPARELCLRVLGGYDSRFLLIPALLASFVLAWRAWRGWEWRAAYLGIAFLNPLLISDFHVGRWDTLILLLWILALRAALSSKPLAMAAWLALAALTKTTLLATALVGMAYACTTRREAARWLGVFAAVFLSIFLPFFLWNPREMYFDMFGATQGVGPHPYPITSPGPFGFAAVVLALGWAASPAAYFPFWILQIPSTLATAAVAVRDLRKERSLTTMAVGFACIAGVYFYFNRYSDASWYGALVSMVALAAGYERSKPAAPAAS